jgi:RNA polymerase sigma factor (sigma-70 family)
MSDASELFLRNLPLIDRTITSVCRRRGMSLDAIEDFAQFAKMRLIDHDYAALRKFQGRSSFGTFIAAVTANILLDYRNHEWGKWRKSAEAERLGELSVELERLLYRDWHSVDEAFHILARQHPGLTRPEIEDLAARIPVRTRRQMVGVEEARSTPAAAHAAEASLGETASRVSLVVCSVMDRMSEEDQLLLRLRFEAGMTVAQIARAMHGHQQQLYRRLYTIFEQLKEELHCAGIAAADVAELIGTDSGILDFRLKNRGVRPSERDGSTVADREEDS